MSAWVAALALAASAAALDIDAMWNYSDPAASEARFVDAMAMASPVDRLQLQTQIARAYSLRRRFDDAHRVLDEVAAAPGAAQPPVAVRLRLERGRTLNSAGQAVAARVLFEDAFERASNDGLVDLAVDAAHMVAITYGGSEQALQWNRRGLALAEASADPKAKRWRLALLNNGAWALHGMARYDESLEWFELALVEAHARGRVVPRQIAEWSVARCLRSLQRHDEALLRQRALLAEHAQAGTRDGFVHEEIAENLLALGRGDEARPQFALAAELLGQDARLAHDEPARLARLRRLGALD